MKVKIGLTVSRAVASEARALGVDMSAVAETAIAQESRAARNRRWVEAHRAELDAYAAEVAREGLPLARFWAFRGGRG